MREQGWDINWLGVPESFEARAVPEHDISMQWVTISGIRGKGKLALLLAPLRIFIALLQSIKALRTVKPNVVLGMGGFVTGPGGIAAKLMRIPLVIHEQNAIPGLTNRWLAKVANQVLAAFPNSFNRNDVVVCGNPVRAEISAIISPEIRLAKHVGKPRLLIVGGSLGALSLNKTVPRALAMLSQTVEVRHQAGRHKLEQVQQAYQDENLSADTSEFIDDMAEAYAWADLVICRAGALTVAELAAAGVASILVPYPYAVDDHQTKNAAFLVAAGAAKLMSETDMNVNSLSQLISHLLASKNTVLDMAISARSVAMTHATDIVASHCQELAI